MAGLADGLGNSLPAMPSQLFKGTIPLKIAKLYLVSRAGRTKSGKDGESMATISSMWKCKGDEAPEELFCPCWDEKE